MVGSYPFPEKLINKFYCDSLKIDCKIGFIRDDISQGNNAQKTMPYVNCAGLPYLLQGGDLDRARTLPTILVQFIGPCLERRTFFLYFECEYAKNRISQCSVIRISGTKSDFASFTALLTYRLALTPMRGKIIIHLGDQ